MEIQNKELVSKYFVAAPTVAKPNRHKCSICVANFTDAGKPITEECACYVNQNISHGFAGFISHGNTRK